MAETDAVKRRLTRWAGVVHDKAATSTVNDLSRRTPKISGAMERSRVRRDSASSSTFSATVKQPAGGGQRPGNLPNWLDEGRQFIIRPRRARLLRFRGLGGQIVYARQVLWNRTRRSKGFWSAAMNEANWQNQLQRKAGSTSY